MHFIGIGGIGISALARMFLLEGKQINGSDCRESPITKELEKLGAKIKIGESIANLPAEVDLVIYTIAISDNHPELLEAKKRGIKTLTYPQALGLISAEKYTIAISGTHGKTTTTAMVAKIFLDAGLDPTVIVGSLLTGSKTNFIAGKSKYFIVEACEYRRSFLNLSPQILVITNIDNDHLDYYKNLDDIKSAFAEMKAKVPADGKIITENEYSKVALPIKLRVPGAHNQKNAQAAIAVALAVGVSEATARQALADFTGTWRRFELKGKTKEGALVYDDYAHHPSEIKATLAGARAAFPHHKIVVVFQPHLYSRTKLLLTDFATSFQDADEVIFLPIYAAREPVDPSISSEILAEATKQNGKSVHVASDFADALKSLASTLQTPNSTLILTMGAGNVFELAETLVL